MSESFVQCHKLWHVACYSLFLGVTMFTMSCQSEFPKSTEEYYYPINELQEGLVYHYHATINNAPTTNQYWFFKSHDINDQKQLTGQFYDENKSVQQYFRQQINPSGALLDEYRLYSGDSIVQSTSVEILYNNVFPFEAKDTLSVYLYKLRYTNPADSSINTITRNRRYQRPTEWEHNGKTYDAIQIALMEQIDNDKEGVISIQLKGYEIYALGIGLVYTERISQDGSTRLVDRLVDRIPMDNFLEQD